MSFTYYTTTNGADWYRCDICNNLTRGKPDVCPICHNEGEPIVQNDITEEKIDNAIDKLKSILEKYGGTI